MAKFRKKPIVIEAIRVPGLGKLEPRLDLDRWIAKHQGPYRLCVYVGDHVVIPTLEGDMKANPGDWIIKGVAGELYPCKHEIFEATYEAV